MKLTKKIFGIVFLTICTLAVYGQRQETLFSNGLGLTGFWAGPKYNFSYFNDDFAYVRGGTFGFEFANTVAIGWSGTRFKDQVNIEGVAQNFKLDYSNFMLNVTPNSFKVIHPIIGAQIGGGKLKLDDGQSERVFIIQPSLGFEVNVFKWLRIAAEGGYRFVSDVDTIGIDNVDVSSPFAQINLKFGFSWGNSGSRININF